MNSFLLFEQKKILIKGNFSPQEMNVNFMKIPKLNGFSGGHSIFHNETRIHTKEEFRDRKIF